RPLWDFPDGTLCNREVAAWVVAEQLGFGFVPPTVLRDGPHGEGSVQQFIHADLHEHYLTISHDFDDVFRAVCLFDLVINNADRKSGHCMLETGTGRIWVIDHGVSFHAQPKLRTVIWDFAGEPVPAERLEAVRAFAARIDEVSALRSLLAAQEIDAMRVRAEQIVKEGVFPEPGPGRPFPWPPV
ncbi:MAG: SCO1664 family protein, partial [Actinomycetota bacterium]